MYDDTIRHEPPDVLRGRTPRATSTIVARKQMLVAYWHGHDHRGVRLRDLPECIDVVNLYHLTLDADLVLDTSSIGGNGITWEETLEDARHLRRRGTSVVATLASPARGDYSWNAIADPRAFAEAVRARVVDDWGFSGIDIDPIVASYGTPGERFQDVVNELGNHFGPRSATGRIMSYLSYDLTLDRTMLRQTGGAFDHIALMGYFWPLTEMIDQFQQYAEIVGPERLLFGVSPDDPQTPLEDVRMLSAWQPTAGTKGGMMEFTINGDDRFTYIDTIHRQMTS